MGKRGHGEGTIYKRKDGKWCGQVTVGYDPATGKPKRITRYFNTRKEAQDWLAQVQHEKNVGTFVEPDKITFGEWLKRWLEVYVKPNRRRTTYDNYESLIRCHLIPTVGHIPLQKLTTSDLQAVYNLKRKEGRALWTLHLLRQIANKALKQAVKENLVARNVNEGTELPSMARREVGYLEAEQVERFLEAIQGDRYYAAYLLELATGLRRGELLALRWQDVDFTKSTVTVRQSLVRVRTDEGPTRTKLEFQEPKTERSKGSVPVPQDVMRELKAHRKRQLEERLFFGPRYRDQDLVFCLPDGRPLDPRNFTRRYEWLLARAGLPKRCFHALRHTVATLLLEAGEDLKVVQEILRHTKLQTTADIYASVTEKLKRRASDKIGEILFRKKKPSDR